MKRIYTSFHNAVEWSRVVKHSATLGGMMLKLCYLRDGGLTHGWYTAVFRFSKYVASLLKTQGRLGTVTHLKACSVLIQQSLGNQVIASTRLLGVAISRTNDGLPRIIPLVHRNMIRKGDKWTFRLWLSLFWVYRVIDAPGRAKLQSITEPNQWNIPLLGSFASFIRRFIPVFLELFPKFAYLPMWRKAIDKFGDVNHRIFYPHWYKHTDDPLKRAVGVKDLCKLFFPWQKHGWRGLGCAMPNLLKIILKSSPNSALPEDLKGSSYSITSIGSCLTDWLVLTKTDEGKRVLSYLTTLFEQTKSAHQVTPRDVSNDWDLFQSEATRVVNKLEKDHANQAEDYHFLTRDGKRLLGGFGASRGLGWLAAKLEPAGKVRIFAMVDNLTQTMLAPLHDAIFNLLEGIPQDGTFDQQRPAKLLAADYGPHFWSYDLSAATDRFPVDLQQIVLSALFGWARAKAWRLVLTDRTYRTPISKLFGNKKPLELRYGAGQPMGALTSWAAFALTHHFFVQYCAYLVSGRIEWFKAYALLGDDIVLADEKVADKYAHLLNIWGVRIGLAKSLISDNGVFEFAKRTYRHGEDYSGISLKALGQSVTDTKVLESVLEIAQVRDLKRALSVASRILGYGFKARSRLPAVLASRSRLQGLAIWLSRPRSAYGLSPESWILQMLVGRATVLEKTNMDVLVNAVQQSLYASLKKLMDGLEDFYYAGGMRNISVKHGEVPHAWHEGIEELENFLHLYVMRPFRKALRQDFVELKEAYVDTLDSMGPDQPLDNVWLLVQDIEDRIDSYSRDLDILTRKVDSEHKSSEFARRESRRRSKLLGLWRQWHELVKELMVRPVMAAPPINPIGKIDPLDIGQKGRHAETIDPEDDFIPWDIPWVVDWSKEDDDS